ncbi:MAG: cysteine desulfurase family protein [Pirellulales bacterium]|nr:cysteine desulfurase family protein [Pirellulales bacterium]
MDPEYAIYLDNNASTPIAGSVLEAMDACARCQHANPSSSHRAGRQARQIIETAREDLLVSLGAELTGATPDQLIFTSGATEANNLALRGIVQEGTILLSPTEHPSVARLGNLLGQDGIDVQWLKVDHRGIISLEGLEKSLAQGEVGLVSVIWAHHETGVLQPMCEIAELCARYNVPLHTDATQIATKIKIDLQQLPVAAMSFSAHKFHGPAGVGGLVVRGDVGIRPLMHGGFQQAGKRPGTESPVLVEGLRAAWQWASIQSESKNKNSLLAMREQLEKLLRNTLPDVVIHGSQVERGPQTTFFSVPRVDRQLLFMALDQRGIACSTGAACESGAAERSTTLQQMGVEEDLIDGALRLSLGHFNTPGQVDESVSCILSCVNNLRPPSDGHSGVAPAPLKGSKLVE